MIDQECHRVDGCYSVAIGSGESCQYAECTPGCALHTWDSMSVSGGNVAAARGCISASWTAVPSRNRSKEVKEMKLDVAWLELLAVQEEATGLWPCLTLSCNVTCGPSTCRATQ